MNFNRHTKQASEVIFSRNTKKNSSPLPLLFNNPNVNETSSQKHLGIILDTQLKYEDRLKMLSEI